MKLLIERAPAIESLVSLGGSISPEGRGDLPKRTSTRYKAGRTTRTNRDFRSERRSARTMITYNLATVRGRSQTLARDNDYFIKFLRMCRTNIIGYHPRGMRLEPNVLTPRGKADDAANRKLTSAWERWCHMENASANGQHSLHDLLLKLVTQLARDGEILAREIPADNEFGYALKFLNPAWLDERFNKKRPNGNRVIMSVEIDANDRPVAYWLTPPADDLNILTGARSRERTRVPADEIIHIFLPFDQNSGDDTVTRGFPWAHAAMINLWRLGDFKHAALVAADIGASKMAVLQNRTGDPLTLTKEELEAAADGKGPAEDDEEEETYDRPERIEAGQIWDIGDKEFAGWDPKYPSDMVDPFIRAMLRGIAADLGPCYFSLTSDLGDVNFSAARIGLQEERDWWRSLQVFVIEHFMRRVYLGWLKSSMLTGALPFRIEDLPRLTEPQFIARGWPYMEPLKDAQATALRIKMGTYTRTYDLAEEGNYNFADVLKTLASEEDQADAAGVDISPPTGGTVHQPQEETKDPNDPNGDAAG
jgi:lambda family phage portal protein